MSSGRGVFVVHAQWSDRRLHLWAEDAGRYPGAGSAGAEHPLAASESALRERLARVFSRAKVSPGAAAGSTITLRLPAMGPAPLPSPGLAHAVGHDADEHGGPVGLVKVSVPTLALTPADAPAVLEALEDEGGADELLALEVGSVVEEGDGEGAEPEASGAGGRLVLGPTVGFFAGAARFARHALAQQRVVPMLAQEVSGNVRGLWQVWLGDQATAERLARVLAGMPPAARCVVDAMDHDARSIVEDFVLGVGDALCRRALAADNLPEAIDGRDPSKDLHVLWLGGLLGEGAAIETGAGVRSELVKGVRRWIGGLEERGMGSEWRLLVRLAEPVDTTGLEDFVSPGEAVRWRLSLHLQSTQSLRTIVPAEDLWVLPPGAATVEGLRLESPQELLLSELGRAARLYKKFESVLQQAEPSEIELSTTEAYKFLREVRPLLIEQGFGVEAPEWWDTPTVRLGARLQVQSEDVDFNAPGVASPTAARPQMGLSSLVSYRWQIAVGETNLTLEQFEKLAAQHSPLVRLGGRWVEIRPEDVKAAVRFIRENPGGEMELGRALRLAYAADPKETGLAILGMEATGWVGNVFTDPGKNEKLPMLESPRGFVGTLRPYQVKGLSWLAFLDRLGLGACLADDMGLGKTVQLLALLAHERHLADEAGVARPEPTLLVVPMSVVANWVHEAKRFTPTLRVLIHHGPERLTGDAMLKAALNSDMVITTYALAHRDKETLGKVGWSRVVLDEAQNIKNPAAKQTRAIHEIDAPRRFALTGTPVENRLTELWSIMDFLNPGYLGPGGEFRRKFAVPIERYKDKHRAGQLRGLVQPFVLRRLKSDPSVITDLPEKLESKEYCYLTPEQATLYQTCVSDMLAAADKAEGIQRRGLVLAGLIKLKQICNHPAHFLKEAVDGEEPEGDAGSALAGIGSLAPGRSGKCQRLVEMLEEVVAAGDKALVFTQFRQMGHLLTAMLRRSLDRDILFLHGGTPAPQRQQIVSDFQSGKGNAPVLLLSLKAGGVGLNLTAATHVFHFDRWWNPAVEAQATDRAYRIGQTRSVQVHKFVVSGTLEERIDQMIEEKTELASEVIGSGERWLTELSTGQLRDLLTLRRDAVGDAEEAGVEEIGGPV